MPTKTEQGDLRFILHAAQGEFPRIVLAPGDVEECFNLTLDAFNLADQLQNPVIIIHDSYLANNGKTVEKFDVSKYKVERGLLAKDSELDKDFKRYKHGSQTGVTLRSLPGQKNGLYSCGSDEHDEYGQICEDPENRKQIMERRMRKLEYAKKLIGDKAINFYGDKDSELTIVGWGSTKGRIQEAMKYLEKEGIKANFIQVVSLSPFPSEKLSLLLNKSKRVVLFEENFSAQLLGLIREKTGFEIKNKWVKYNGIPFSPSEVFEKTKFSLYNYTK